MAKASSHVILAAMLVFFVIAQPRGLSAQDRGEPHSEPAVFHPGRLRVALRDDSLILSWVDASQIKKGYAVYRSSSPLFDSFSLQAAEKIGTVAPGIGSFTDRPPDDRAYYYLVLGLDRAALPYEIFIPGMNTSASPLALAAVEPVLASEPEAPPASPYPSELRVALREKIAQLRWKLSPEIQGGYSIYRSGEPLYDADNLRKAENIAKVDASTDRFDDQAPPGEKFYYLVLGLDEAGQPYEVFVPGENASAQYIAIASAPATPAAKPEPAKPAEAPSPAQPTLPLVQLAAEPSAEPAAEPEPAKPAEAPSPAQPTLPLVQLAAEPSDKPSAKTEPAKPAEARKTSLVTSLRAEAGQESVLIRYTTSAAGKRLVLYRGSSAIKRGADLLYASIVAGFADRSADGGGTFTDYPAPGLDYWYALIGEDEVKSGSITFSNTNATIDPVRIRGALQAAYIEPRLRGLPLPGANLVAALGSAADKPNPARPGQEGHFEDSASALSRLLADAPRIQTPIPPLCLLAPELDPRGGGEDYELSLIVSERLVKRDWETAITLIRRYLSLNRSAAGTARARFYLGQALAFAGEPREALLEFISLRRDLPTETAPWIDYSLYALNAGGRQTLR